ncbi:hypothetical protein C8F04DRAFT_1258250 [Mycena alexandri]|uniref:Uncharacterized protein n=1 Tax=Mycena alexandri TaxID=1745969 RepID=A0AAD6SZ43_9AGAR|nr:hypothetical protein C8F04DRAFT_1258250 [Mycena alexandri]
MASPIRPSKIPTSLSASDEGSVRDDIWLSRRNIVSIFVTFNISKAVDEEGNIIEPTHEYVPFGCDKHIFPSQGLLLRRTKTTKSERHIPVAVPLWSRFESRPMSGEDGPRLAAYPDVVHCF